MIQLKNINKSYHVGDMHIEALKNITLSFRKHEFVSVLGQSGCGKTTFLNVLGGLDNYDSGDLIIEGTSTKTYHNADWDSYRNRYVGFVFQSYNLIMHLTVLENVELALSIAGISKEERKKKALEALESVGIAEQSAKKPNQLSGGQMQRVAIARAIVNDPEIILADEPTGALDTTTSVQILDILKKLSATRLVVMVTHNQELAEKYSTRIVRMLDGNITSDSQPYEDEQLTQKDKKNKKIGMKFWTALNLSFRNLLTKKTRTFLTAFAGSIGIIGISLILALSSGFQTYVNKTQQDTMSSYPITIEETSINLMGTLQLFGDNDEEIHLQDDQIGVNAMIEDFLSSQASSVHKNDLQSFKTFVEQNIDYDKINGIQYVYNVNLNVYKNDNTITQLNPVSLSTKAMSVPSLSAMFSQFEIWKQLIDNQEILSSQYDFLGESRLPEEYNEVVLVLDENNQINDFVLYALGLRDTSQIDAYIDYLIDPINNTIPENDNDTIYSPNDFLNLEYKMLVEADYFRNNGNQTYTDIRTLDTDDIEYLNFMQNQLQDTFTVKIVGVIRPKRDATISSSMGSIGYTSELIEYIIGQNNSRSVVTTQMANQSVNVLTNSAFESDESYDLNLKSLGVADLDKPSEIRIYPSNFETKEYVIDFIDSYNNQQPDNNQIQYTDMVGLLISAVSTIINAITYVLIAFVSISLVVSSIMIGIITYISVLERTKEIGILRSVGARKRDVSNVFNAETLIVGFISGSFGILSTYLLSIPANIILESLVGISSVASLQILHAIILIAISMGLTLISGLIPAAIAAKKDPVKALREE